MCWLHSYRTSLETNMNVWLCLWWWKLWGLYAAYKWQLKQADQRRSATQNSKRFFKRSVAHFHCGKERSFSSLFWLFFWGGRGSRGEWALIKFKLFLWLIFWGIRWMLVAWCAAAEQAAGWALSGSLRQEAENVTKGTGTCDTWPGDWTLRDMPGAKDLARRPQTTTLLDCEDIKA